MTDVSLRIEDSDLDSDDVDMILAQVYFGDNADDSAPPAVAPAKEDTVREGLKWFYRKCSCCCDVAWCDLNDKIACSRCEMFTLREALASHRITEVYSYKNPNE